MSVELGSVREIWLAPSDDHVGNKHSFLVRDDAYVMSEATFGRQVRLGQPIDLGPNGSWNQSGWFGGYDQERWLDEFMYEEGGADTTDRVGRIRLWPGFEQILGRKDRPGAIIRTMTNGASGEGEDTPLLIAEHGDYIAGTPDNGYALYAAQPGVNNTSVWFSPLHSIKAMAPIANEAGDSTGWHLIGTDDGRLYRYDQDAGTVTLDPSSPAADTGSPIGTDAIIGYNGSTYYGRGRVLRRRTFDSAGLTHTDVKSIGTIDRIESLVVWQNRLWFLGIAPGGETSLFTSDGVTVVSAIDFPIGFRGRVIQAHYGSLYVGGEVDGAPGGLKSSGQLWRYNGSSLIKLWDGSDASERGFGIESICSWDRFVVWPRHGSDDLGRCAGVWLYDAEEDAILEGPCIDMDPAATHYAVTAVAEWNSTIAIAVQDRRVITAGTYDYPYAIFALRRDGGVRRKSNPADTFGTWGAQSFGYEPTTITRKVKSSAFDGELLGTDKLWLSGFLRCKMPLDSQVRVTVSVDGGAEVAQTTVSYDGNAGWRNVRFPLTDALGGNIKGATLSYTVYVENLNDVDENTKATPEIDFVGIQFKPAEEKRRIWYVRVIGTDGQERLDEQANPLATRKAIVDKLVELWKLNGTLSFWEAEADGVEPPTGEEVEVTISNLTDQSWRLSETSAEVMSEVSFSLLENA